MKSERSYISLREDTATLRIRYRTMEGNKQYHLPVTIVTINPEKCQYSTYNELRIRSSPSKTASMIGSLIREDLELIKLSYNGGNPLTKREGQDTSYEFVFRGKVDTIINEKLLRPQFSRNLSYALPRIYGKIMTFLGRTVLLNYSFSN